MYIMSNESICDIDFLKMHFLPYICLIGIFSSFLTVNLVESYLVFSNGGLFKLVIGWGIPVDVPMSVIYAQNIQFQYMMVTNASMYALVFQEERQLKGPITRNRLINAIQPYLNRDCLLYLICESAAMPLVKSGLIGELLVKLLTPSVHSESDLVSAYNYGSEDNGRKVNNCMEKYGCCSFFQEIIKPFLKYSSY